MYAHTGVSHICTYQGVATLGRSSFCKTKKESFNIFHFVESGLGRTIDISCKVFWQILRHRGGEAWWGLDDRVISGSYTTKGGEGDSRRRAQLDQTQERRCQVWV